MARVRYFTNVVFGVEQMNGSMEKKRMGDGVRTMSEVFIDNQMRVGQDVEDGE